MSTKRGRPISGDSSNAAVLRRRELGRARQQRWHAQRQKGVQLPISQEQLQQGEKVIDLNTTQEEEAAATLVQLGLRVQGITLAQDPNNLRLHNEMLPVDEPGDIYHDDLVSTTTRLEPGVPPELGLGQADTTQQQGVSRRTSASRSSSRSQSGQRALSHYFRSLPPRNPNVIDNVEPSHTPPSVGQALTSDSSVLPSNVLPLSFERSGETQHQDNDNITGADENTARQPMAQAEAQADDQIRDNGEGREERANIPGARMRDVQSAEDRSSHPSQDGTAGPSSEQVSPLDYTLEKLSEQLQRGFHGCSMEEHEQELQDHMTSVSGNHNGLDQVSNDTTFPSVLPLPGLLTSDRLDRQQRPTPEQWHAMFCGVRARSDGQIAHPEHVCLHEEKTRPVESQVAYDIDSFLGFASSLSMARQGIWYQPAPQMRQNITADNHVRTPAHTTIEGEEDGETTERVSSSMIRDVPHFLLGRIVGAHDITVHVLFPHIPVVGDKFISLTTAQLTRWLDDVFHPAVYQYCGAHYTQHLPASFRHAWANSKAHQVEDRLVETRSYQAQQSIGYHLQPEYLEQIWDDILDRVNSAAGLRDFREPQLFFSAKGTKLQFKTSPSRPTLVDAMDNFVAFLERVVDLDCVQKDRLFVDVGKEICPCVSVLPSQRRASVGQDEAQVYMWKRCCLEKYMNWMYDGRPPSTEGAGQTYFTQNMLHQACSLTSVTPKKSRLRQGGLIYSQFYGSVKELSDATKCFPFANDGLEELALDPLILKGARQAAGGRRRDGKIVEKAYLASKSRTNVALRDSMGKSFGLREEHRIRWDLFCALQARIEEVEEELESVQSRQRRVLITTMRETPTYAWAINTTVYLNFLWRSADKFATGFEVIHATCRSDLVTWEQTKMMAMFLRCLRFVFGGHLLRRESSLWWSRREKSMDEEGRVKVWYGLGLCNTMKRYGYGWMEPRFDWRRLQFKAEVTDHVMFGNQMLRGQYLRQGRQVRAFFDLSRRLEMALVWLGREGLGERRGQRLVSWMAHVCLEQFRRDVLVSVRQEISAVKREEAVQGKVGWSYDYLDEIMSEGVHLVSGNRSDYKEVHDLGRYLFEYDDGRNRTYWGDKPYRKLFQRACEGALFLPIGGRQIRKAFRSEVYHLLYKLHWILPYPSVDSFMQTTKQGWRMWYSVMLGGVCLEDGRVQTQWIWGRKNWREGYPQALPDWIEWDRESWQRWVGVQEDDTGT